MKDLFTAFLPAIWICLLIIMFCAITMVGKLNDILELLMEMLKYGVG